MDYEPQVVEQSSSGMTALIAFGLGAVVMYFFDPVSGRRRRALLRDQVDHARHVIADTAQATAKDLRNRAQGMIAETRGAARRTLERDAELKPASPEPRV
jgi:ribosomal protein S17E